MMNNRDEQLSAFHDGALNQEELKEFLHDLQQNPVEDAEKSFRYSLMSDAMRDEVDAISFMDVSAAVHRAIDKEDTYVASVSNTSVSVNRKFDFSSWLRPLSGMAIAASVAMVTVVSFRTVETESSAGVPQLATETQTQQDYIQVTDVLPVNSDLTKQARVVSVNAEQQNSALRAQQLNEYLMDHSGYAGQNAVQGMMPYVRVVSYGSKANQ